MSTAIKKPLSAYNYFCSSQKVRAAIRDANPGLPANEMMAALGARWKSLSEEEKGPFVEQAQQDKQRFLSNIPNPLPLREDVLSLRQSDVEVHRSLQDRKVSALQTENQQLRSRLESIVDNHQQHERLQRLYTDVKAEFNNCVRLLEEQRKQIHSLTREKKELCEALEASHESDDDDIGDLMTDHIRMCKASNCPVPGCIAQRSHIAELAAHKNFGVPMKKKEKPLSEPIESSCCICMESPASIAFIHGASAHLCICQECSAVYRKHECPLCQCKGCDLVKVY